LAVDSPRAHQRRAAAGGDREETPEVLQSYIERINHGFNILNEQIEALRPTFFWLSVMIERSFHRANMPAFVCSPAPRFMVR
jgi:hypothetical protein